MFQTLPNKIKGKTKNTKLKILKEVPDALKEMSQLSVLGIGYMHSGSRRVSCVSFSVDKKIILCSRLTTMPCLVSMLALPGNRRKKMI